MNTVFSTVILNSHERTQTIYSLCFCKHNTI